MKLIEFVEKFIESNSLIRLVYKEKEGHSLVLNNWDDVSMEWEILKKSGKYKDFINNKVLCITSISTNSFYSDAINIVIEK